jgi:hypothetical protein
MDHKPICACASNLSDWGDPNLGLQARLARAITLPMKFLWELLKRKVAGSDGDIFDSEPPWKAKSVIAAGVTSGAGLMA